MVHFRGKNPEVTVKKHRCPATFPAEVLGAKFLHGQVMQHHWLKVTFATGYFQ